MPDSIIIPPSEGNFSQSNLVSSSSWNISPPEVFLYWMMNDPAPANFNVTFRFPDIPSIPNYEDFTEWQFETEASHVFFYIVGSPSVPFTRINGELNYVGDLGSLGSSGYYEKTVALSFFNLELLAEGQYIVTHTARVTALNASGEREVISEKVFKMIFHANQYLFQLNPPFEIAYSGRYPEDSFLLIQQPVVLNYYIGGEIPSKEVFYFGLKNTGSFPPTILETSDEILKVAYAFVHEYFSKVLLSFDEEDIEVLEPGEYSYLLEIGRIGVTNPDVRIEIPVILNVFEPESDTGFFISPAEIIFNVVTGAPPVPAQVVNLISEESWQMVSEIPSWLGISQVSGEGNAVLLFYPVNYSQLEGGTYQAVLQFVSGDHVEELTVIMNLQVFLSSPFEPGKLYFTKNTDYLKFTTELINTYIELVLNIKIFTQSGEERVFERIYNIPFADKKSEFHIGSVVHDLFEEIEELSQSVPDLNSNYWLANYRPAEVSFSFEEKVYQIIFIPPPLTSGTSGVFMFVKGYKPFITGSQLSLLTVQQQHLSRIQKNSPIGISFTAFSMPTIVVRRNNIVIEQLVLTSFSHSRIIYSYYRFINDLKPGDVIEIFVSDGHATRSHRYLVHPEGKENTFVFFENHNGVMEVCNLSGKRRITSNYEHTSNSVFRNLFSVDKKLKTQNRQSFVINTGKLEPDDKKIIDAIVKSEKVWVGFSGYNDVLLKCSCVSSKKLFDDTDDSDFNYDLEFNILENSNALLYN